MMRKLVIASAVATVFAAPAAVFAADAAPAAPAPSYTFTGNVTLTSEYDYRGIEQSYGKPAVQGGFDYAHTSGAYVGIWGSSISWVSDGAQLATQSGATNFAASVPTEIDVYGGYKNAFGGGDWNYDVGVLTYNYPGYYSSGYTAAKPDTIEVYGALGWKWITAKYSYVVSDHIFGFGTAVDPKGSTKGSGYFDLTASYDLGGGWGVSAHYGDQKVKDFTDASYTDYRVGLTKDVGFGSVGLNFTDTNAKHDCNKAEPYCGLNGRNLGQTATVLSFTKTM